MPPLLGTLVAILLLFKFLLFLSKGESYYTLHIIIDSKSGVSGAGRGAKEANLYIEIAEASILMALQDVRMFRRLRRGSLMLPS
ncbi:hypothetical protein MLD38_026993 [Melastoma candidum]|uniref:Uncharacterized protein n=1 Tax=Melastoma candidum TaxID=119954 RepID=A0ACB9P269_9MYRT|nr:hypothetical protein MLD38_026993 [Melastoma candidum]